MWKLIATYAPLLGATLITGALTIDEFHNWYDCLAGAIIGSVMAISAYRMVYASVFDFRFNHIPLTRHTPFSYGAGAPGAGGFETAVWTRKAGWGHEEGAFGGAPGDADHGLRGMGGGVGTGRDASHGVGGGVLGNGHDHGHGHRIGHTHATSAGSTGQGRHSHGIERRPVPPSKDEMRHSDNIV
jgi:diacylglycerol diphosphate phosphatase / phosphatidate phosphatase